MPQQRLKILVVDDHAAIRGVLHTVFTRSNDFNLVGQAENAEQAFALVPAKQPDIVLLDIHMRPTDGIQTAKQLSALYPSLTVIGFSDIHYEHEALKMINAGAVGVIPKTTSFGDLLKEITDLHRRKKASN